MVMLHKVIVSITIVCIVLVMSACSSIQEEISIPTGENNTSVTISKNEDDEVTHTFIDEDGTKTTTTTHIKLPVEFPDYIPIPKEAEVVSAADSKTDGNEAVIVQLVAEGEDIQPLVDMYSTFWKEHDYEVLNEISSEVRYTSTGRKGDEMIMINIMVYDPGEFVIMINRVEGEF